MNTKNKNALIRVGESIAENKGDVVLSVAIISTVATCFELIFRGLI